MQRLALKEKFGYGLGDTLVAAATLPMSYSGHLLALKIGIALGGALSGWILAYVGYQLNVEQSETAVRGIVFLYAWASAIAGVILFVCFKFYRLNREWAAKNELLTEAV